jgi:hypothetical protein
MRESVNEDRPKVGTWLETPAGACYTLRSVDTIEREVAMLQELGATPEDFREAKRAKRIMQTRHAGSDFARDDWDYARAVVWRILVRRRR